MELKSFTVSNFRSINDSTTVEVESDVTCLMGKNESGKSALLEALYLLNPIHEDDGFDPHRHIPWDKANQYTPDSDNLENLTPISAKFRLTDDEIVKLQRYKTYASIGHDVLIKNDINVAKTYTNRLSFTYNYNEEPIVAHLLSQSSAPLRSIILKNIIPYFDTFRNTKEMFIHLKKLYTEEEISENIEAASKVFFEFLDGAKSIKERIDSSLAASLPQFVRFTDYHLLVGRIPFAEIRSPSGSCSIPKERVNIVRSLIRYSLVHSTENPLDVEDILDMDRDNRRRFLDVTASQINQELEKRWTQARRRVKINEEKSETDDHILVYVENEAEGKVFIEEESAGFRWFLSFIVAFSDQIVSNRNTIILLDEPGLGLHGRQQEQLLRFIIEKSHPVIYTTHSFALVENISPDKIRLVEQADVQIGTKVYSWNEREHTDEDTFFPMVVALGYRISSKMYWGGDILLVEGYSDYHYLTAMDSICSSRDAGSGLPSDLNVRVSSGKDNIRNLVALIGPDDPVIAIIDSDTKDEEKLKKSAGKGSLRNLHAIEVGNDVLGRRPGCIEDLFIPEDYIAMVKLAGHDVPTIDKLKDSGVSIARAIIETLQISEEQRGAFKVKIAATLARKEIELHENSINNFKKLFGKVKSARTQLSRRMMELNEL